MNIKLFSVILNATTKIAPKLKSYNFSDGKFNKTRGAYLLAFMIALGTMAYFLGVEQTEQVVEMLDDVSDVIGHME